MGKMCEKHEQFVQDGAECPYCDQGTAREDRSGTEPSGRCAQSEGGPASGRSTGLLAAGLWASTPTPPPKRQTPGGWYSGYDTLDVGATGALYVTDRDHFETPAVTQANGLTLPAMPLPPPDPTLRADLAAEFDRQEAKGELMQEIEALIDKRLSKLRAKE